MPWWLFNAAIDGDTKVLNNPEKNEMLYTTPDQQNNILHIAVRYGHLEFIKEAIHLFPTLLQQKNKKKNSPLHEAAALATQETVQCIISYYLPFSSTYATFLKEVNDEGDTPFHVALRSTNMAAAEELFRYVKYHPEILVLKTSVNEETPLHLYVRFYATTTRAARCYKSAYNVGPRLMLTDNGPQLVEFNDKDDKTFFNQLVEANLGAMFEVDWEGMNPLMRAAHYGLVHLILGILKTCPQSMECRDSKGSNFLHHLRLKFNARDHKDHVLHVCRTILGVRGVDILSYLRDENGNTPIHSAILAGEFELLQLILERHVEKNLTTIKTLIMDMQNFEGKTILDLIATEPRTPLIVKNLMEQSSPVQNMFEKKVYRAASKFNVDVLMDNKVGCHILNQDMNGKNILHIATEHWHMKYYEDNFAEDKDYNNFIEESVKRFPQLLYQKDCNDDTPLHVAARVACGNILLHESTTNWYKRLSENGWKDFEIPPWMVKNSRGHTLLHEAARSCCTNVLSQFYDLMLDQRYKDMERALSDVNQNGETPLHLIARYTKRTRGNAYRIYYSIIEKCKIAANMRDIDGLTPVLRAAKCGHTWLVAEICKRRPESIYITDYNGKNVWHYLCSSTLDDVVSDIEDIIKQPSEKDYSTGSLQPLEAILSQDADGNTPLHLAIKDKNFEVATTFITHFVKVKSSEQMTMLLEEKRNKDGKSILNLIKFGSNIPEKLKQALVEKPLRAMLMDGKLFDAAKNRNIYMLYSIAEPSDADSGFDFEKWLGEAHDGSNIIHIALQHSTSKEDTEFIEAVLEEKFELIYRKDSKGDTPLHLAAGLFPDVAIEFLKICDKRWAEVVSTDSRKTYLCPWTLKNSKGNTFFHEAARLFNYEVVFSKELEARINEIKDVRNDKGETVLHVIARSATSKAKDFLEKLSSDEMRSIMYIQDVDGFTPILKAVQYGRIKVATLLHPHCPLSTKIPDNKGRTILHHLRALAVDFVDDVNDIYPVWRKFYDDCHLEDLRTVQDEDGNTALHSAIIEGDSIKVKFLMDKCLESTKKLELYVVNNAGHTVFDLVSSSLAYLPGQVVTSSSCTRKELLQPLVNRIYVKERELVDEIMEEGLYKAAVDGRIDIFDGGRGSDPTRDIENNPPYGREHFCSQTPGGSCIIHISLRHGKGNVEKFIEKALEKYPILSTRPDSNGDTPLHLAAKWKSGENGKLIMESLIRAAKTSTDDFHVLPWAVKNNKGSFPIHEALQSGNLKAAHILLDSDNDPDAASRINDLGETALHTFAKNCFSIRENEVNSFVNKLLDKNKKALYVRDDEGLTPLLRASKSGRLEVAEAILRFSPQSAYVRDLKGRTFLHLLNFTGADVDESLDNPFKKIGKMLFKIPEADAQRLVQDYDGNTPLHYTIKNGNSIAAIVLTHKCLQGKERKELHLLNKAGETIPDLLTLDIVPNEIIELIQEEVPEAVYIARSSYGIRKTDMKESANALSVVAALLATITFGAAFQVPGGFGDDGFPILMSEVAFAIFCVANTTAMCSSMLCLFLLLWVMGIGKTHGTFKVLDTSIILLRLSFYLTLLTFTTGVFVATAEKSLWMGAVVCVLGFLTFLLTFKKPIRLVTDFLQKAKTSKKKIQKSILKSKWNPSNCTKNPNKTPDQPEAVLSGTNSNKQATIE